MKDENSVPTAQKMTDVSLSIFRSKFKKTRIQMIDYIHFGAHNLYVPAEGCVYVAPSMIAHYVDVHSYEPPAVFWGAVMNCPEMGSETYRQALIANGPSNEKWVRAAKAG
jgi:hypothetical protein